MAGRDWTPNDRAVHKRMFERGDSIGEIAEALGRTAGAVSSRATRAGLKRPERETLTAGGHHLPVVLSQETVERIDKQSRKRSPYVRQAVALQLELDESGIKGTPMEIVARLLRAS